MPALQSLKELFIADEFATYQDADFSTAEVKYVASLSALTRLKLNRIRTWHNSHLLRKLPLQQLCLHDCHPLEIDLLTPGAPTQLTSLCIFEMNEGVFQALDSQQKVPLQRLSTAILSLPQLQQIQACGPLLRAGLQARLEESLSCGRCVRFANGLKCDAYVDMCRACFLYERLYEPSMSCKFLDVE